MLLPLSGVLGLLTLLQKKNEVNQRGDKKLDKKTVLFYLEGVMMKYAVIIVMVLTLLGCRTSFEKRVKKDIIGINEQIYDLEKEQIKTGQDVQGIKQEFDQLKKKEQEEKDKKKKGDQDESDTIYKNGYESYLKQNYKEAIDLLSQLTKKFEDNPLTDNALYWQAESYFKLNQMDNALKYYQLLFRYFPFSNKADYALYKIGMIYYNRKEYSRAFPAFSRLAADYPGSDLNKAANIKINQIKRNRRRK